MVAVKRIDLPGLEPRGAVRVDVGEDSPVAIVGAHLGLLRRHRRAQLTAIVAEVAQVERAVVLGDFNEWSETQGLEALAEQFDVHAPGRTFHAARPVAALDRIAVTKSSHMENAGVDESPMARRASDHLPVWSDLAWSE